MTRNIIKYAIVVFAVCALSLLVSCSTAPKRGTAGEKDEASRAKEEAYEFLEEADRGFSREGGEAGKEPPEWTRTYPQADGCYIGIGHSPDTGDPAEDKNRARLSALNELAQGISVHIEGEVRDRRKERYGEYYEEMEIHIRSSVDLTVQDAELVDSYYSKDDGYWVYYRLSKDEWERQQKERERRLVERVALMVGQGKGVPHASAAERISTLADAISVAVEAGSAGLARAALFNKEGYLLDLLISEREVLVRSLMFDVSPTELPVSPRGAADVEVAVGSGNGGQTGVFCVAFEDEKGSPLAVVKTDEHGGYTGGIDLGLLPFGRSTVVARIELPGSSAGDAPYTETRVTAHRESYTALLLVTDDCGIGETAVYGAAFDMLSRIDMPSMRIAVGEEEGELVIEFAPSFRVIQNKQYKLYAAYASARLAVRRGGDVLFSCGSEEYKDMVLNALQAKQRAFKRLLEALKNDESLRHALQNELSTLLVH